MLCLPFQKFLLLLRLFFFLLSYDCVLDLFLGCFEVLTNPLLFRFLFFLSLLLRPIPDALSLVGEVRSCRLCPATCATIATWLLVVLVTGRQVLYEGTMALPGCLVAQSEAFSGSRGDWWLIRERFACLLLLASGKFGWLAYRLGAVLLSLVGGGDRLCFVEVDVLLRLCLCTWARLLLWLFLVRPEFNNIDRRTEV